MKLVEVNCPNCKGMLKVNPEKETLVCGYCHTEFKVDDEIKRIEVNKTIHHVYTDEAKILREENNRIKQEEKRKNNQEKLKHETTTMVVGLILPFVLMILLILGIGFWAKIEEQKSDEQEQLLEQIVEEVKADVNAGKFDEAYLKAKSIYYTENFSSEIEEKWEKTRKEMIDYVIREEKRVTGKSSHKSETTFWDKISK